MFGKTFWSVLFSVLAFSYTALILFGTVLNDPSQLATIRDNSSDLITVLVTVIVFTSLLFFCRDQLRRRWSVSTDSFRNNKEKYLALGVLATVFSGVINVVPLTPLFFLTASLFLSPMTLLGVLIGVRFNDPLEGAFSGFLNEDFLFRSNWGQIGLIFLFWTGVGAFLGYLLNKIRNRDGKQTPFGLGGFIFVWFFELVIGVGILCLSSLLH